MLRKAYIFFYLQVLILASVVPAFSQNFPVSVNTTITPPYSTYLADYVAPGSQKLALNIFLNDINRPELQTRLRLRIEGQGILIETKPEFLPAPLLLQGGIPERLISSDLAPYFLPQNLNFSGITRQQFERSGQLPEGLYSICFEVLEYNPGVKVSNSGCTMAWLILNDPPLINLPRQAEKLKPQEPQYVTFQWTPRHTGSPNSAFSTEYEFTLVELWPESRNPNDAILTSPPIYQTTTQSTTLIYGPAETPLVPGRRYAFRVKAKSISGIDELDLFKNQGYSQVHSFQYGDACDIPLNIKAKATNSGTFKIIYEPNTNHTAFSIRYRKANDPKATWYEVDSYFEEIEINGLQPETTYEYQLTAGCGPFDSEYSPVALVTTDAMPEVTYACGLLPEEFDFGNTEPLPSLQRNDILYAGDFNVKISEATGSAGNFTGKGTVVVPYLDNLAVSVEFSNITVNTEYRMTAGSMDVKGIGVDILPDNFTDFLDKLDETLASIDDVLGDVSAGLDIADEILGEVGDLANDILDNGPFTTEEEVALDGLSVEEYNERAKDAINGAASALGGPATVESIAEAARKVAQGMALKNRANKLQNIYNNSDTLKVIAVEFYENLSGQGKYGFDVQAYAPHRLHYNIMVLPVNQTVPVPWAATKAGEAASIKAKFLPNDSVKIEDISFKSGADGSTLTARLTGNEWTITLPPITKGQSLVINAVDKKGETVGKLNAIGYEPIERKVHLIPIGAESQISETEVQTELNRIYAQALASWTVEKHAPIQVEAYDGTLQDDEQVMLSTYSDGMKAIIKAYQATEGVTINDNDFYLFLVGNSQTDKAGYMPRKHRFGFIYQNESSDIKRTIAHELGHGAFRLQHVWEEYPTISETTANLMDYGTGTNLRKYQWDLIHNPPVVVGLVEDLEEGALGEFSNLIIKKLLSAGAGKFLQCKKCETETEPNLNPEIGGTYNFFINDEMYKCIIGALDYTSGKVELVYDIEMVNNLPNSSLSDYINLDAEDFMLVYKSSGSIIPCNPYDGLSEQFCSSMKVSVSERDEELLLENLSSCIDDSDFDGDGVISYTVDEQISYTEIRKSITQQLENEFFSDGKSAIIGVKLHDANGKSEFFSTNNVAENKVEIKLSIKVDEVTKTIKIKSINTSETYLEKFVGPLQSESDRRGKGVNVEAMRVEIITDIESVSTNRSFVDYAFQNLSTFFNESVGKYVEVVQVSQKVTKTVWDEGQMSQGHWWSKAKDAGKWPSYAEMNPLIAGPLDGIIDEITGIPLAIKSIYGIATDAEQREAFSALFSAEGAKALTEGIGKELSETLDDDEKLIHTGGKTTIAVAFMFITGGSSKGISLLETLLGQMSELGKYKKLTAFLESVRKLDGPEFQTIKKQFDEVFSKFDQSTIRESLDKLIELTGKNTFRDIWLPRLHQLKDIPGVEKVIKEMAEQWGKNVGHKFVIEFATKRLDASDIKRIIKFEARNFDEITGNNRIYDIVYETNAGKQIRAELKNWDSFYPSSIRNQFVKDLNKMTDLGEIKWFFKKSDGVNASNLKEQVLNALKKQNGNPVDELNNISLQQVKKLLGDDFGNITQSNRIRKLTEALNDDIFFESIFEVVD